MEIPTENGNRLVRRSPTVVPISLPDAQNDAKPTTEIEALTESSNKLLKVIKDLTHHGIDAELGVPKIVVIGDQSSGKSSLIEALTRIPVPRGEGTCTRCPLEINILAEGDSFSARIFLQKKYLYDTDEIPNDQEFPGWTQLNGVIHPELFMDVNSEAELGPAIVLAQCANLNPDKSPAEVKTWDPKNLPQQPTVAFSPNTVIVEIKGAETRVNLSFVDLPGIITRTAKGVSVAGLVRTLSRSYIRDPNSLIALVISMEYDIMVSQAPALVDEMHAKDRCIGILTKPDRLPKANKHQQWRRVLQGEDFVLGHGYYVTKQLADANDGNFDKARKEEERFFTKDAKWVGKFVGTEDRLGTNNVRDALSSWLRSTAQRSLPSILQKIHEKLEWMDNRLQQLPEPHREPRLEVQTLIHQFIERFTAQVSQDSSEVNSVWSEWIRNKKWFEHQIIMKLRPKINTGRDIEAPMATEPTQPRGSPLKRANAAPVTPSKRKHREMSYNEGASSQNYSQTSRTEIKGTIHSFNSHLLILTNFK
jgi:GTPase SAR1 family protein